LRLVERNRLDEAKKVLRHCDQKLPDLGLPYGQTSRFNNSNKSSILFGMAAKQAGDTELAKRVLGKIKKDLQQQIAYYSSLNEGQIGSVHEYEFQMAQQLLQRVEELMK